MAVSIAATIPQSAAMCKPYREHRDRRPPAVDRRVGEDPVNRRIRGAVAGVPVNVARLRQFQVSGVDPGDPGDA